MKADQPLLSTGVAAKALGVNPATLRRWVELGLIPAVTLPSGVLRFRADDVAAALTPVEPATGPIAVGA